MGGTVGALFAHAARTAFISGMDLGLLAAAVVAFAGAAIALATVPGKAPTRRCRYHRPETTAAQLPRRRLDDGDGPSSTQLACWCCPVTACTCRSCGVSHNWSLNAKEPT